MPGAQDHLSVEVVTRASQVLKSGWNRSFEDAFFTVFVSPLIIIEAKAIDYDTADSLHD